MKLCINCRHYQPATDYTGPRQAEFARCARQSSPEDTRLHRVDGRPIRNLYCDLARNSGDCGHDAALFEPRLEVIAQGHPDNTLALYANSAQKNNAP